MILRFSTQLNGKPTYFVEKIWKAIFNKGVLVNVEEFVKQGKTLTNGQLDMIQNLKPKLHTIRTDEADKWNAGETITFVIHENRQSEPFIFAPIARVESTQEIFMTYAYNDLIEISIDGRELFGHQRLELAINDGFDNWEDFFDFWCPKIKNSEEGFYKGKLIHWTDLKY
jgi:hypothetical protein